jgi:hypothetical protein
LMWNKVLLACVCLTTAGCRTSKPVEITEVGWVVGCADQSPLDSPSHGRPWILFSTNILGHSDTITFNFSGTPPCSTWKKTTSTTYDLDHKREPDYELTRLQHTDWRGRPDETWDLVKMRSLSTR